MDLTDKIKQIQISKKLSPSIFADEIGVQRASISHILAGRNKPSLDIVQKIVKRFPDLGLNWILDDEILPEIKQDTSGYKSESYQAKKTLKEATSTPRELSKEATLDITPIHATLSAIKTDEKPERKVERIMLFYSDGTFQELKP